MKNLILSLVMFVSSFVSFSQVIEVEFGNHIGFNCGQHNTYEEVIRDENILGSEFKIGGTNKYVVDLTEKTVTLYFNGSFIGEESIIDYKMKNGLLYVTMSDVELSTNKKINTYIVINQTNKDNPYPKFTFYFISTVDGSSNGFKTI